MVPPYASSRCGTPISSTCTSLGHNNDTVGDDLDLDLDLDLVCRGILWAAGQLAADGTPAAGSLLEAALTGESAGFTGSARKLNATGSDLSWGGWRVFFRPRSRFYTRARRRPWADRPRSYRS